MYPQAILDEVTRLQKQVGMVYALADPFAAVEEALEVAGLGTEWTSIDVFASSGPPYLAVYVKANAFQQIGDFGKVLHKHGLRLYSQANQGKTKRVSYEGPITLYAVFEDDATCKWVKVGEKIVDVLELQCEGDKHD